MKKTTRAKLVRFGFEGSDRQAADEDWREAMEASTVALAKLGSFHPSTRSVARVAPLPPGASDASNPTPARARSRPALLRLRSDRGVSQEKLAELAGVSRSVIAKIESGQTRVLTLESAKKLAKAFGVTLGALLGIESSSLGEPVSGLVELHDVWVTRDCAKEFDHVQATTRGAAAGLALEQWAQDRWAQQAELKSARSAVKASRRDRKK